MISSHSFWEFEVRPDQWQRFGAAASGKIDASYHRFQEQSTHESLNVALQSPQASFKISFKNDGSHNQTNLKTSKVRSIRRTSMGISQQEVRKEREARHQAENDKADAVAFLESALMERNLEVLEAHADRDRLWKAERAARQQAEAEKSQLVLQLQAEQVTRIREVQAEREAKQRAEEDKVHAEALAQALQSERYARKQDVEARQRAEKQKADAEKEMAEAIAFEKRGRKREVQVERQKADKDKAELLVQLQCEQAARKREVLAEQEARQKAEKEKADVVALLEAEKGARKGMTLAFWEARQRAESKNAEASALAKAEESARDRELQAVRKARKDARSRELQAEREARQKAEQDQAAAVFQLHLEQVAQQRDLQAERQAREMAETELVEAKAKAQLEQEATSQELQAEREARQRVEMERAQVVSQLQAEQVARQRDIRVERERADRALTSILTGQVDEAIFASPDTKAMDENPRLEALHETDVTFKVISEMFRSSFTQHRKALHSPDWCSVPDITITSIEEITCKESAEKYSAERRKFGNKTYDLVPDVVLTRDGMPVGRRPFNVAALQNFQISNETILFHGTTAESVNGIVANGFDPQRGGEKFGAMFGTGTYFAHNASKCDMYSKESEKKIVAAKVLLGKPFYAKKKSSELKRAPGDAHSVIALTKLEGGTVDHREYIIYKREQILPSFVITYCHKDGCQCHNCSLRWAGLAR